MRRGETANTTSALNIADRIVVISGLTFIAFFVQDSEKHEFQHD